MDFNVLKQSSFVHLFMAISFFTSGLIVNFIQCVLYLCLRPINKVLYRKINWYLCWTMYAQLVVLGDWWCDTKILIYSDPKIFHKYFGKEHAFCVMNHTYEVDWLIGWMLANRVHCLGNCKAYTKKVIQYIPVLGWAWKFSDFVFLERSFEKDKEVINKQIQELAEHPDPIWLVLYPEGTRFTPKKQEASLEFAVKNNLPHLKHHLLPRTKGFIASLPAMKGKVPAVYELELAFKEDAPVKPTIRNMLLGKSLEAHFYMRRIPMEEVPTEPTDQEQFLRDVFIRKDKMKDSFLKTGDFFTSSGVPKLEPFEIPPTVFSLYNFIFWQFCTLIPISYYLVKLLFSGELLYFSIGMSIIGAFYLLLNKTIGMTEINKASSYGSGATPKKVQ